MSDDVLRRAARALRDRSDGAPPPGRSTKQEVLRALDRGRAPASPRARALALALAAALVVPTAWAAAATGRMPSLRHALSLVLGPPPPPLPALGPPAPESQGRPAGAAAKAPAPGRVDDAAPAAAEAPDAPEAPADATASAPPVASNPPSPGPGQWFAPTSPPPPSPPSPSPAPPRPATAPTRPPAALAEKAPPPLPATTSGEVPAAAGADELYERAHRAHFAGGDPAAALAAWDRYLAAAPRGRFALEARYNRAVALARLGRRDEAARALAPFAAGEFGGYRRAEAERLLRSLR
jgi:hypothetical protein